MANMSYCRFHNTRLDMEDCLDVLCSGDEPLSEDEAKAARQMFEDVLDFCRENGIIDSYDSEGLQDMLNSMTEKESDDE